MSTRNFRGSLVLVIVIFMLTGSLWLPVQVQAWAPSMRFFHLTIADGLSHNMVRAIVQDPQGFLWFGTQDGLNRYDGYSFAIFRHLRSDPHSLVHNTVQALAVDSRGVLWVGTVGGIDRFDRHTSWFIHYPEVSESVTVIYSAPDGALWVGTAGAGLFRYDPETDRFIAVPAGDESSTFPYTDPRILALYQTRDGALWVGTEDSGLWTYRGDRSGRPCNYRHDPAKPYSLPCDRVTAMVQDASGRLWIGTGKAYEPTVGGLVALDPLSGQFRLYQEGLDHKHITAILEDGTSTLWVGMEEGLAVLDRAGGEADGGEALLRPYRHDPLDPYSLINDRIYTLYEDHAGVVWIGTDGGVSRYVREKNRFGLYRQDPQDPNSLGAPRVGAVLKDRDGILWVGLHAGGLDRVDLATGQVTHYRHAPTDARSLSHDHVTALWQDKSGAIWVGTSAGLDRLDFGASETPLRPRFAHYVHDPSDPDSLGPGTVKVIFEDRSGILWVGTEEPGTLSRLDLAAPRFTVYRYDPANPDGFPNTYGIRAILEDREGILWLGTYSGLVRFDRQLGTFTQYRHDPADVRSLSDDFVWSLYEDPNGTLWVGTHGGLNRLDDRDTGQFTIYTIENGLPNDGIAAILGESDHEGRSYLWLATMGGGLSRFDPGTETFRNYDVSDGLQGMHFIPGAAFRSSDGELFFGGTDGLTLFDPATVRDNLHTPPIVLTAFRNFDQIVDFERDLADLNEITLSYRDNFFSFEFAALDYADPVKNQYAYILQGFDRDWVYCGTRRYAAYTNVPPGTYTFRAKGSNNDGVWNEEGLAVRVVITPPFWQTWWFRMVATLGVLGFVSVITVARMRYVARLRRSEERFRTLFEYSPVGVCEADLMQSPPRVIQANSVFGRLFGQSGGVLAGMAVESLFAPESRTALERLCRGVVAGEPVSLEVTGLRADGMTFPLRLSATAGPGRGQGRCILVLEDLTVETAVRSEEEAIAEERQRIAREIHDGLAQDLAAVRLQVRRWQALVESDPVEAKMELEELHRLLGEKIREVRRAIFALRPVALDDLGFWGALPRFLEEFGEQNQLHVSLSVKGVEGEDRPALPTHLELVLFRILQEALNNVAKHAQARTVWVDLDLPDGIVLRIRDDGVGFDPAILLEKYRRGHLGLRQMWERVQALGGTMEVRSQPGRGTEIWVKIKPQRILRMQKEDVFRGLAKGGTCATDSGSDC